MGQGVGRGTLVSQPGRVLVVAVVCAGSIAGCTWGEPPEDAGTAAPLSTDASIDARRVGPDHASGPASASLVLPDGGPCTTEVGELCDDDSDCCPVVMIRPDGFPAPFPVAVYPKCLPVGDGAIKLCTTTCTPLDPTSPWSCAESCTDEEDRPYTCATAGQGGAGVCLPVCEPTVGRSDCPAGLACRPESSAFTAGDVAVCLHRACTSGADCPVQVAPPGRPIPGRCDLPSGLCLAHGQGRDRARVGDPCEGDPDCGPEMRCEAERPGPHGVHAGNGYCTRRVGCRFAATLPDRACPAGSACTDLAPGGLCLRTCDLEDADGCRGHPLDRFGDYDCYEQYRDGAAVCAPADLFPCQPSELEPKPCAQLGTWRPTRRAAPAAQVTNVTEMACRDRQTGAVLAAGGGAGLCLDLTTSGCLVSGQCIGGKVCDGGICRCPGRPVAGHGRCEPAIP